MSNPVNPGSPEGPPAVPGAGEGPAGGPPPGPGEAPPNRGGTAVEPAGGKSRTGLIVGIVIAILVVLGGGAALIASMR